MPPNPLSLALKHAFTTQQIRVDGDSLEIAKDARRQTVGALTTVAGIQLAKGVNRIKIAALPAYGLEAIRRMKAEQKIQEKYGAIGGRLSPLGLPLNSEIGLQSADGTYYMEFRGGRIQTTNPLSGEPAVALQTRRVEVRWVGLECRIRQEKTDEVYGMIGCIIPSTGASLTHKFPADREAFDMGPDGMRIVKVNVMLYNGPPANVSIVNSLVEHDSGDIENYKRKVADAIAKAAGSLATMEGVPAEATAAGEGWINDLSLGLVNWIADVLGLNDDAYVPQTLALDAQALMANRPFPTYTLRRGDDPRTVDYTHSIVVTGIDDGGDRGEYGFYFDVKLIDVAETYL